MSHVFREYLKRVGSGPHTGSSLSRSDAADATRLMLQQIATPAQIGGFLIAHRIRRPTGEELAGMLDAYLELGPRLDRVDSAYPVYSFGVPYDGRSRTAPLMPLIALVLASAGLSVITHGGDRMPTKAGLPLIELWQGLDVAWERLDLVQVQDVLRSTGLGFVYLPRHFPLAQGLVQYREEIGKRPPLATLELMWSPYAGHDNSYQVCGFVHPPTEMMFRDALTRHGITQFTTVKGLEGSCDLPRDRPNIIGLANSTAADGFERLTLNAQDFNAAAKELPLVDDQQVITNYHQTLAGEDSDFTAAIVWSGGFYLWRSGICADLPAGMAYCRELLDSGKVQSKLAQLQGAIG
jgi:anthranilate phosphoribosyltransferase